MCIWRIARVWSLFDGIEVPDNMKSCISFMYGFEEFWRNWHRGFNIWLIRFIIFFNFRYIFIPLGGSRNKSWNIWFIFTFVAIWHDWDINLILWAWIICGVMMPEVLLKAHFN